MKDELARRQSLSAKLEEFLKARPVEWIPMKDLAAIGGIGGWRTRLSELGRRKVDPLHLEHNGKNGAASCHRYLPHVPLGRDASEFAPRTWETDGPFTPEFKLTPP